MHNSPDRLAQDFRRALQELQQEKVRTRQLLTELDRQNAALAALLLSAKPPPAG